MLDFPFFRQGVLLSSCNATVTNCLGAVHDGNDCSSHSLLGKAVFSLHVPKLTVYCHTQICSGCFLIACMTRRWSPRMPSTNGKAARTLQSRTGRVWLSNLSRPSSHGFGKQKRSLRITRSSNTQNRNKRNILSIFLKSFTSSPITVQQANSRRNPHLCTSGRGEREKRWSWRKKVLEKVNFKPEGGGTKTKIHVLFIENILF